MNNMYWNVLVDNTWCCMLVYNRTQEPLVAYDSKGKLIGYTSEKPFDNRNVMCYDERKER